MNQQNPTPQESFDLTNDIVSEFGRLFLLVEAIEARNLTLQNEIDTLKARVKVLESRESLLKMDQSASSELREQ